MTNENETKSERFNLMIERIKALRAESTLERGVDPMQGAPELVRAVADAADIFSARRVAKALGMGESTVGEWRERARRASKVEGADAASFGGDLEIRAIVRCVEELDRLDREGRSRVLNYLDERYFGRYWAR